MNDILLFLFILGYCFWIPGLYILFLLIFKPWNWETDEESNPN